MVIGGMHVGSNETEFLADVWMSADGGQTWTAENSTLGEARAFAAVTLLQVGDAPGRPRGVSRPDRGLGRWF